MWTNANRARYDCSTLRYPSALTDAEWALIYQLIPQARRGGTRRYRPDHVSSAFARKQKLDIQYRPVPLL